MIELTDRHLEIPKAVAAEMAIRMPFANAHREELIALGNLRLVELAHKYDTNMAHNGADGFGFYAVRGIRWLFQRFLENESKRQLRTMSMDRPMVKGNRAGKGFQAEQNDWEDSGAAPTLYAYTASAVDGPDREAEVREMDAIVQRLSLRLHERERLVLCMLLDGMTERQISEELGVSRQRIHDSRVRIRKRIGRLIREAAA